MWLLVAAGDRQLVAYHALSLAHSGLCAWVADLDTALATNAKGYAFGVKHAARAMQRNFGDARKLTAGSIVNIASTSGLLAQPGFVPYSMTKGAVMQLSRCAALDLGKHGIRCGFPNPHPVCTWIVRSSACGTQQKGTKPMAICICQDH